MSGLRDIYEINHSSHKTLYSMEGLRGLAVFLVFLVHYVSLADPWISGLPELSRYASLVHSLGNTGVDLFFVLSGYLIYGSLIKREISVGPYLARRIQRIYPAFVAVFVLYVALSLLFPEKSRIPEEPQAATVYLVANFLLLPGMLPIEPMITVAWSLSYEFFFYLTVPLLVYVLKLRRWRPGTRVLLFVCMAAAILSSPESFAGHVRLAMFLSGMLVFEATSNFRLPSKLDFAGAMALAVALIGTVAQSEFGFAGEVKFAILGASFFVLCTACFYSEGHISRIFRWTPLRWLGNISYSYYLIHSVVLQAIALVAPKVISPTGTEATVFYLGLFVAFPATVMVSTLLFVMVEKPYSLASRSQSR